MPPVTSTAVARDLHAAVAGRLADVGQRYTAGRRAVVEALSEARRPLTVAEILGTKGSAAQSSVYRHVAVLEHAGVVRRVQGADELVRIELAEDLTGHHHHLVCVRCGDVSDYTIPAPLERNVERAMTRVTRETGFRPETHRLDLVGVCARCA